MGSGMKRGQCDWLREQRDGAVGGEGRGRSHRALVDHGKAGGYFIKRAMESHIRDMFFGRELGLDEWFSTLVVHQNHQEIQSWNPMD